MNQILANCVFRACQYYVAGSNCCFATKTTHVLCCTTASFDWLVSAVVIRSCRSNQNFATQMNKWNSNCKACSIGGAILRWCSNSCGLFLEG